MAVVPRSPLELIHPDGVAARAFVLGEGLPDALHPHASEEGPYDLIVAVPPRRALTRKWAKAALGFAAARLAPEGVAYLITRRFDRPGLERLVVRYGLSVEFRMAHLPRLATTTFLAPIDSAPVRVALGDLVLLPGWRRRALGLFLGRRDALTLALPSLAVVVRRPGSRGSFQWLSAFDGPEHVRAIISRSRRAGGPGFFVLQRFTEGDVRPSAVAKVAPVDTGLLDRESRALESTAQSARAAGAEVPALIASRSVGTSQVLLLESVPGRLAATLLAESPRLLEPVTADITRWLLEWARLTAGPLALTHDALDAALINPARLVAEHVSGGTTYAERIEKLCAAVEGRTLLGCAAHNDLTMWNLLVAAPGRIGVVDWEASTEKALPLVDFYYAIADAVAAVDKYRDRARSFSTAYFGEQRTARWVSVLEERVIGELRLERWAAHLGFHACWLSHASNELRLPGLTERPFLQIVEAIAGGNGGARWWRW
jgi:hypothetical protein